MDSDPAARGSAERVKIGIGKRPATLSAPGNAVDLNSSDRSSGERVEVDVGTGPATLSVVLVGEILPTVFVGGGSCPGGTLYN